MSLLKDKRFLLLPILLVFTNQAFGMHIAEGFLPASWSIAWWVVFILVLIPGYLSLKKNIAEDHRKKLLFAVAAAFVFVLSSLKLPSVAGSSSHLTGVALGAILFGASSMSVIGLLVLLFQALLLAHGGLSTLGANAFSMAVVGSFTAVAIYGLGNKLKFNQRVNLFSAAFFSDLMIYVFTSVQLAAAFSGETTGFTEALVKFLSVFAVTQLPLAVIEGILTVFVFELIKKQNLLPVSGSILTRASNSSFTQEL